MEFHQSRKNDKLTFTKNFRIYFLSMPLIIIQIANSGILIILEKKKIFQTD